MNPMKLNELHERSMQPVLILEGAVYLPHYTKENYWCGPGANKESLPYTTKELMAKGAVRGKRLLWPRAWTEKV